MARSYVRERRIAQNLKLASQVSDDKLRGGFYTPPGLVAACLDRVFEQAGRLRKLAILEPSCGDGAFLKGLSNHRLKKSVAKFTGVELMKVEAQKCREAARSAPFDTCIRNENTLEWVSCTNEMFDAVVGNPPFVRYQFVPKSYLKPIEVLGRNIGVAFRGVSNLWIPMLVGSLSRLRVDGSMSLVVPAEIFTGLSAGDVRSWLLKNFDNLRVDSFAPGAFPNVLQEVVVLSGSRTQESSQLTVDSKNVQFVEHDSLGHVRRWQHQIPNTTEGWTRYLLTPDQLGALEEAKSVKSVQAFSNVAKLEVSIVTGANDYFSVDEDTLERFNLRAWAKPLLPRVRHVKGLVYTGEDHAVTIQKGAKAWLLHFSGEHPDPLEVEGAMNYIRSGEARELNKRYKTSIRVPWYRVPSVWAGKLMLSKRSHWFPQLILNEAGVLTTDTIYRGNILPLYSGKEADLVAAFHNSLTLLTAEIEGRSFGGGVLELVPSEIARLLVPFPVDMSAELSWLDQKTRHNFAARGNRIDLLEVTDQVVSGKVRGLTPQLMDTLRSARETLAERRFTRN